MRRIYLLFILAVTVKVCMSQDMGVIEVNKEYTATLNFAENIDFIVVGNNPPVGENKFKYYDIFQSGKSCVIRSNDPLSPETSITIKLTSEAIWYGKLKYSGDPASTKIFYDFSKDIVKKIEESKMQEVVDVQSKDSKMKERLNSVLSDAVEYRSLGAIQNGLIFQVANFKNDDNYSYIKFIITNNTGSDYNIDGIYFKYLEGKRKGLKKKEAGIEERISPVFESPLKLVKAYSTLELGYIIPLFTVGKQGNLSIQLREEKGTRNPTIDINGDKLLSVKVFEQKLIEVKK